MWRCFLRLTHSGWIRTANRCHHTDCVTRLKTDRLFAAQMRAWLVHTTRDFEQVGCQECMEIRDPSYSSPFSLHWSSPVFASLYLFAYFSCQHHFEQNISQEGHYETMKTRAKNIYLSIFPSCIHLVEAATPNVKPAVTDVV